VTFTQAVKSCFLNYCTFEGRAPRSEYWYWALFTTFGSLSCNVIDYAVSGVDWEHIGLLGALFSLGTYFPDISVQLRRCTDGNISKAWAAPIILFFSLVTLSDVMSYTSEDSVNIITALFDTAPSLAALAGDSVILAVAIYLLYMLAGLAPVAAILIIGLKGSRTPKILIV
jgi:uncharacterized membrane protein YhaH (DUF805 family)